MESELNKRHIGEVWGDQLNKTEETEFEENVASADRRTEIAGGKRNKN